MSITLLQAACPTLSVSKLAELIFLPATQHLDSHHAAAQHTSPLVAAGASCNMLPEVSPYCRTVLLPDCHVQHSTTHTMLQQYKLVHPPPVPQVQRLKTIIPGPLSAVNHTCECIHTPSNSSAMTHNTNSVRLVACRPFQAYEKSEMPE